LQNGLILGHGAGVGLMGIDQKPRRTVGGAHGRYRYSVRSDGKCWFAAGVDVELFQDIREAVEERCLEHESCSDVPARQRQKTPLHTIWMQRRKIIDAICVGL